MQLPTIHINGTPASHLLEDSMRVSASLRQAIRDLENAGPNERDYYVQGCGAFRTAQREHQARIDALVAVRREIEAISEHVADFV